MKPYLSEFIKFANSLADTASETSMYYFRKKINIENKDDESPVTIADKKTERKLFVIKFVRLIQIMEF